jgi:hypothetical protein
MRFSRTWLAVKYANRTPAFGAALLFFFFGLLGSVTLPEIGRDAAFFFAGETVQAVVKGKQNAAAALPPVAAAGLFAHGGGRRGPRYLLHYEFTVGGKVYGGAAQVARADWEAAQLGQPLEVVYFPSDPAVNRAGASFLASGGFIFLAFCVLGWAGGLAFVVSGVGDVRRRVRLLAEGVPALGVIDAVNVRVPRRKGKGFIEAVRYSFLLEQGGEKQLREGELTAPVLFRPGEIKEKDVIVVVCDAADPDRHELDCFDARRADRLRLLSEAGAAAAP